MVNSWHEECERNRRFNGQVLYGQSIEVGCPLKDIYGEWSEKKLVFIDDTKQDCGETIKQFQIQEEKKNKDRV